MAYDLKVRTRFTIPGTGFDSSGTPKNDKVFVAGELDVTSYTTGGETVTAADLGLSTVDVITFDVRHVNDAATEPTASNQLTAHYIESTEKVMIKLNEDAEVTSSQDANVRFVAVGDSGTVANLT